MVVKFAEQYRPLYFLSALGAGGLAVSLFMYPMFLIKHPDTPIPTYADLEKAFATGDLTTSVLLALVLLGVAFFAGLHLYLLAGNLVAFSRYRRSAAHAALLRSNGEVTLMAVPLTLAMSVNVLFIAAALAVPGLWDVVEYLFPFALTAFGAIGAYALAIFGRYLGRILAHGGFDLEDTNHFSQVLPSFTFAMVAVGFSSPGAMSHHTATSVIGILGAFLFGAAAVAWGALKVTVSFGHMLRKGAATEAGPTLWIGIPILTLFGIAFVRVGSGISHNLLDGTLSPVVVFVVLGILISMQLVIGLFGWSVMRHQGYFSQYVSGPLRSVASYGLICPGVAFSVLTMFFIHWGLVRTGVIEAQSAAHFGLLGIVAATQFITAATMFRLNAKLLGTTSPRVAEPQPVAA